MRAHACGAASIDGEDENCAALNAALAHEGARLSRRPAARAWHAPCSIQGSSSFQTLYWRIDMANRNQDYSSGSRGSQQNWRDDDDGRNEAEAGSRGGNYDQGRVQYGRREQREQNDQSGSTGRYAGYGDFGRGNYGGGRSGWSGQDRYGQSGYGEGDYGQSNSPEGYYGQGNFGQGSGQTSGSRGVSGQNDWRAGGFGDRTENDR